MAKDVTLTIDGTSVTVPEGTLLVEAAKLIKHDIPVYCYHPKMGPAGLCRICLVEIEKMPKLQIACNTPVADGMVVHSINERATDGRRAVLEFLLKNHPLDCPICDKGGECDLQDFSMAYGSGFSRLADPKQSKPKAVDLGPTIVLDEERCIVCQRCVRFDQIITQENVLRTEDRGSHTIIATATDEPYKTDFTGNVTELCPVGALTSKTYRFKSRPWDLHRTRTSCTQCSVGCGIAVDVRRETILRTMSIPEDDAISDGWLCDRGRYNVGFYSDERRLTTPLFRSASERVQIGWDDAIELWAQAIRGAIAAGGPDAVAVIGGGRLLNEEAYVAQHLFRALGVQNVDSRGGRQRTATPGRFGGTLAELESAQAILTVGRPPSQTAPVMDLRIRKAVAQRGAALFSVGAHAAHSFVPERTFATLDEARAALPDVERIAVVWDGIDPAGAGLDALLSALADAGKTVRGYIPGEAPNARGAEAMGVLPRGDARDTRRMLEGMREGTVRVLTILGANPFLHYPDRALVEAAFAGNGANAPFVAVSDLFLTETAERASLVLPAYGPFEKSGTALNVAGDLVRVETAATAPEGALADGDMLVALADVLDVALPLPAEVAHTVARLAAEPSVTTFGDASAFGAPAVAAPEQRLRLAIGSHIFSGGGTAAFDERIGELVAAPVAIVEPATGLAFGLAGGDTVDLHLGATSLPNLIVRFDAQAKPGVVTILDGVAAAPANAVDGNAVPEFRNVRKTGTSRVLVGGGVA